VQMIGQSFEIERFCARRLGLSQVVS
jgi:hypothetical protein